MVRTELSEARHPETKKGGSWQELTALSAVSSTPAFRDDVAAKTDATLHAVEEFRRYLLYVLRVADVVRVRAHGRGGLLSGFTLRNSLRRV